MNVHQKEIVLLPYPFSDLEGKKVRPAVIVSNDKLNENSDDCIVVPLTSVLKEEPYSIRINQEDLVSGKLIKPSRVRTDKLFTVEKRLTIMKIGVISNPAFENIKSKIFKLF